MKIVVTLGEYGAAANVGGDVERVSVIIEVPLENIPIRVLSHLKDPDVRKWQTISLSILDDGSTFE